MRVMLRHPETSKVFVCETQLVTFLDQEEKLCINTDDWVFKVVRSRYLYESVMHELLKKGFVDLSASSCEVIQE